MVTLSHHLGVGILQEIINNMYNINWLTLACDSTVESLKHPPFSPKHPVQQRKKISWVRRGVCQMPGTWNQVRLKWLQLAVCCSLYFTTTKSSKVYAFSIKYLVFNRSKRFNATQVNSLWLSDALWHCSTKLVIIFAWVHSFSHVIHQAIISNNAELLSSEHFKTSFDKIWIKITKLLFGKRI